MSLWDTVKGWFVANSEQILCVRIPDPNALEKFVPGETYFGLWLTHSYLHRQRVWLEQHYPAAHVSVRLDVAGETRTLTRLARPATGMVGPGVWSNFRVTGLLPYDGGTLELEAGLSSLRRSSLLGAAVEVVDDFSSLVVPPVSEVLGVAGKVATGIQTLLDAGDGEVFLGTHQAFVAAGGGGDSQLQPGYLAVIGSTERDLDPAALTVENSILRIREESGTRPLEGFNYLLFRIEARRDRDDWRFPRFDLLIRRAKEAHFAGERGAFERNRDDVLAAILNCADLTRPDRRRISIAVRDEIQEAVEVAGAVGPPSRTLAEIAARAPSLDDPVAAADFSLRDLVEGRV